MDFKDSTIGLLTESIFNFLFSTVLISQDYLESSNIFYQIVLPYHVVESYMEYLSVKFLFFSTTLFLVCIFNSITISGDVTSIFRAQMEKINASLKHIKITINRKCKNTFKLAVIANIIAVGWVYLELIGEHGTPEYFLKFYPRFIFLSIIVIAITHSILRLHFSKEKDNVT